MAKIRVTEVPNHKEEIPMEHYLEAFAKTDPEKRAAALALPYEDGRFTVPMYGVVYTVSWPDGSLSVKDPGDGKPLRAIALTNAYAKILLLRYLMEGTNLPSTGNFMTFREMPWGEVYIKPFTGRCITRAAFKFGRDLAAFREKAEEMGGVPIAHGDAGYEFRFLGEYRIRLEVWEGDDEFPPSAQFLYTSNFAAGFSAEDCVVAAETLINALSMKG